MKGIFRFDSPVMRFFPRVADLMALNAITLLCMVPLVTIGASLTGMHHVLLTMVQDREGPIVRSYWHAFRENFGQSTVLWLIMAAVGCGLGLDLRIFRASPGLFSAVLRVVLGALSIFWYLTFLYVFPLQARFVNQTRKTLKNALLMSIAAFPRTLGMLAAGVIPFLLMWYWGLGCLPLLLLLGVSGPGYLSALLYTPYLKRFEQNQEE